MRLWIRVLIWLVVFVGAAALAEEKAKTYKPTEVQSLRLQVRQKDALIAQKDLQLQQQRFQGALNELNAEADRVKKENSWPADVIFNGDTLQFSSAPIAEKKP